MNIPFTKNPELYCAQACMKMIIDYFDPNNNLDLERLAKLSYKRKDGGTNSVGIVLAFDNLGYKATLFTKKLNIEHENSAKEYDEKYGISKNELNVLIKKAQRKKLVKVKLITFNDLKSLVKKQQGIITLIDFSKISKKNNYIGHYLVITNITNNSITFHQPGTENATQNCTISKELFLEAFNAEGTDNDVIVIEGKNENK